MLEPELMKWIYEVNPYNYADLSAFIKNIRPKTEKGELESALKVLSDKGIIITQNIELHNIPSDITTIKNASISLTDRGRQDVENWRFHEDSKTIGEKANGLAKRVFWVTIASTAFIGLTFWKECRDTTQARLQDLSTKEDNLRIELQNIRSSLESVNHSIQHAKTDTLNVKIGVRE